MKNTCVLLLATLLSVSVTAQTKVVYDPNAQVRTVSSFHAIEVSHGIDLYLTQSGTEEVAVSAAKDEDRDKIMTVVENGVLKIYYDSPGNISFIWGNRKLRAYVSVKNIDGLDASGGSDVDINGTLTAEKLKLELSGGSDFKGNVNVTDLDVDVSGGSDVNISGKASNITIDASGGSDFNGYDLTAEICNASCSGGSDVTITVTKEITADSSGHSDIFYSGGAVLKKVNSSGGSSIKKRG